MADGQTARIAEATCRDRDREKDGTGEAAESRDATALASTTLALGSARLDCSSRQLHFHTEVARN